MKVRYLEIKIDKYILMLLLIPDIPVYTNTRLFCACWGPHRVRPHSRFPHSPSRLACISKLSSISRGEERRCFKLDRRTRKSRIGVTFAADTVDRTFVDAIGTVVMWSSSPFMWSLVQLLTARRCLRYAMHTLGLDILIPTVLNISGFYNPCFRFHIIRSQVD
jgi:hypothetical protein